MDSVPPTGAASPAKKPRARKTAVDEAAAPGADAEPAARGAKGKKKAAASSQEAADGAAEGGASAGGVAKKAKAAPAEKEVVPRTPTPRAPPPAGGAATFKVLSWNVAGLRALLNDGKKGKVLQDLVAQESPDAVCLQAREALFARAALATAHSQPAPAQEHKLQASLRKLLGPAYGSYFWAVSTEKLGYSGIVVIVRGPHLSMVGGATGAGSGPAPAAASGAKQKTLGSFFAKAAAPDAAVGASTDSAPPAAAAEHVWSAAGEPARVSFGLGPSGAHAADGRSVTLEFARFALVCAYVPNSGEGLTRLDFRINEWERDMRAHLTTLAATKPVVYGGDLNVAHLDADIWNPTAKHIPKSAGTSPAERAAFGELLATCDMADTFRARHPDAVGCFTFWSTRAGNRPFNRGLRLDYFLASACMLQAGASGPKVHDAFIFDTATNGVSDHAPVGVMLTL